MSSSQPLGPYVIGERIGSSVWLAEDTRNGKRVVVKLLSRSLPKDAARREAMIREIRVNAALYHASLVPIIEVSGYGDNLVMVMELVEGQTISKKLAGKPVDRQEFFRLAFQLASVVKYLHVKNVLHANLNADAVLITAEGQVKLGGLNLTNLQRRERTSSAYQQKGSDLKLVSYMAPEQIASQAIDERTDIFSVGVLLYELATGRVPFTGAAAPDVARAIIEGQPASPRSVNPQIDNAVLAIVGTCLFKDPFKRYKDAKGLVDAIEKVDSDAVNFAAQFEKRVVAAAAQTQQRRSILLVADVANYDQLAAQSPEIAAKAAARMQQVLGESVYLFDGKVVDPFGTRMVAELPSIESAVEAGRKGEFDFSPGQQEGDPIDVRMLLHAGDIELRDGIPVGPVVERAFSTLAQLSPNTLFISEEFVKEGRPDLRLRDAGARGGVKLYTIAAPEPAKAVAPPEESVSTAELEAEAAAEAAALLAAQGAAKKKKSLVLGGAAAVVLLLVLAGVALIWSRRQATEPVATATTAAPAAPAPASAENPRTVHLASFTVEGADPVLAERAQAIHLGALQILRTFPELRIADAATPDVPSFSAVVRTGAAGPEIVPTSGPKTAPAVPLLDAASGIRAVVQWVASESTAKPRTYAVAEALNSFADALVARSANDATKTDASLRAAMTSDPSFLPAQMLAMEYFSAIGKEEDALAAAKQVATLDPGNLGAVRKVARASMISGDLQQAFASYQTVLLREPQDAEALNHVARYSLAIGDTERFNATLRRMRGLPQMQVLVHEPDLVAATGRIDAATQRYYLIEEAAPDSASLALKIGRFAVLRHSLDMANFKLEKLAKIDPLYSYHMLSAYIAAEKRQPAEAMKELELALSAAQPGDDSWTSAAEVHAILNDTENTVAALEKAVQRKEPTAVYILASPLFRYLQSEARFQTIRSTLASQQEEIRTALAQIR